MGSSASGCHLELSAGPKPSNIRCAVKANAEPTWLVLLPVTILSKNIKVFVITILQLKNGEGNQRDDE